MSSTGASRGTPSSTASRVRRTSQLFSGSERNRSRRRRPSTPGRRTSPRSCSSPSAASTCSQRAQDVEAHVSHRAGAHQRALAADHRLVVGHREEAGAYGLAAPRRAVGEHVVVVPDERLGDAVPRARLRVAVGEVLAHCRLQRFGRAHLGQRLGVLGQVAEPLGVVDEDGPAGREGHRRGRAAARRAVFVVPEDDGVAVAQPGAQLLGLQPAVLPEGRLEGPAVALADVADDVGARLPRPNVLTTGGGPRCPGG